MIDSTWTSTGDRPDLASPIELPEGFIGAKVFPTYFVNDKSGTLYYLDVTTIGTSAAQLNRGCGTAPTTVILADSTVSFTCSEMVKRAGICPDEVKQMGGIARADVVGANFAKRQVLRGMEEAVADTILGGAADLAFSANTFVGDVATALLSMKEISGKSYLVGCSSNIKNIYTNSTINAMIRETFGTIRDLSESNMYAALAALIGVDGILGGNDLWADGANSGKVAIVKVDNSDPLAHKYNAVLGRNVVFLPNGEYEQGPFIIRSAPNYHDVINEYDAYAWGDTVELNAEGKFVFSGV